MDIHRLCFSHPFNVIVAMMKNDAIGDSSKRLSHTATSFRQLVQTVTSAEEETTKAGTSLYAVTALKFAELTTKLNHSVELSAMETAIRRYLVNLLVMQKCSAKRDCPAHEELYDEITRFNSTLEDFSLNLHFIQNRIMLQLDVVYSLVAQRDSRSNLDVAVNSASIVRASKRDSSAMKAIAVITAFFLPGTFIAALFSMPLFDWSSNHVISPHFYIYWAFTGPLTVLILAVYAVWTWLKITQHANQDEADGYRLSSLYMSSTQPLQRPISETQQPVITVQDQRQPIEQVIERGGQSHFALAMAYEPSK